jgi:hypothetical protein
MESEMVTGNGRFSLERLSGQGLFDLSPPEVTQVCAVTVTVIHHHQPTFVNPPFSTILLSPTPSNQTFRQITLSLPHLPLPMTNNTIANNKKQPTK